MAFAVSTVVGVGGLLLGGAGLGLNLYEQSKAADAKSDAARQQAEIAQLQAANVDTQQQKLALDTQQQQLQIQTQKDVITQQAQADAIRMQASELDARRRTRDAIRQGNIAASTSLVRAVNQGAGQPGSSVIQQSASNITNSTNWNVQGINQSLDLGERLYGINKNITSIYLNAQDVNSAYVNQSAALQSKVLDTQRQIYQLGGQASLDYASAASSEGTAAIGSGLAGFGGTLISSAPKIGQITQYFGGSAGNLFFGGGSPTGYGTGSPGSSVVASGGYKPVG